MSVVGLIPRYSVSLLVSAGLGVVIGIFETGRLGYRVVLLVPVILALYFWGEWAAERLVSDDTGHAISSKAFSLKRILLALMFVLLCITVLMVARALVNPDWGKP